MEGTFVMRYRCFNIFAQRAASPPVSVLAECYGGPFKIHSTKEFPGLRASTGLTKVTCTLYPSLRPRTDVDAPPFSSIQHLALYGVRVNLRENERKRRKKSDAHSASHDDAMLSGSGGEGPAGTERSASHSPTQTFYSPTASIGSSFASSETAQSLPRSGPSIGTGRRQSHVMHQKTRRGGISDGDEDDE
ncbi:hypothetical protein C8Q79DRAFT_135149 [Trametes meyenii]|nr:hypothetical protein C8Q79DRAFT_135149 [Trametes meyenii]